MAARALHIFLVAWGALEILLFGGLIFGWASLVYVFKRQGYFRELCGTETGHENVTAAGDPATEAPSGWDRLVAGHGGGDTLLTTPPTMLLLQSFAGSHIEHYYNSSHRSGTNTSSVILDTIRNVTASKGVSSCHAQDKQFNLVYTLATVINGVTLFVNGWIMDKYGTRLCRCIGILTYVAATLMAAFSTPSVAVLLYPSMILLALGGYYFIMTNFQLGNILPSKRSTIISLYCGAYDSSAFILLLIKFGYEGGVSLRTSFLLLTIAFSICIVSTFLFMPHMRIPHPIPDNYRVPLACTCKKDSPPPLHDEDVELNGKPPASNKDLLDGSTGTQTQSKLNEGSNGDQQNITLLGTNASNAAQKETVNFYSLVSSPLFLWDLVWLTCHRFASWSFVGRLNPALNQLADGDTVLVGQYTSVYAALQFFGIFLAPLSGRLMDRRPKHRSDTPNNPRLDKLEMCIASFILDSTVGTLLAITLSIPILKVQYVSFVLHVIHRACLYGPNSAFIAQAFPMEHFGKLFGLAMSFAAAFSMLQFPIFVLIQGPLKGNTLLANMFTLMLMLISYGHPLYIYYWCRRERQQDLRHRDAIYKPKVPLRLEVTMLATNNTQEDTPLSTAIDS